MRHEYCIAILPSGEYLEEPNPNVDNVKDFRYPDCRHLYDGLAENYAERWDAEHDY